MSKEIKPESREGYGILNPYGEFWSTDLFNSPLAAHRHWNAFWRGNKNGPGPLPDDRVIPAEVTIRARTGADK